MIKPKARDCFAAIKGRPRLFSSYHGNVFPTEKEKKTKPKPKALPSHQRPCAAKRCFDVGAAARTAAPLHRSWDGQKLGSGGNALKQNLTLPIITGKKKQQNLICFHSMLMWILSNAIIFLLFSFQLAMVFIGKVMGGEGGKQNKAWLLHYICLTPGFPRGDPAFLKNKTNKKNPLWTCLLL